MNIGQHAPLATQSFTPRQAAISPAIFHHTNKTNVAAGTNANTTTIGVSIATQVPHTGHIPDDGFEICIIALGTESKPWLWSARPRDAAGVVG
jgi:hypothetical protein